MNIYFVFLTLISHNIGVYAVAKFDVQTAMNVVPKYISGSLGKAFPVFIPLILNKMKKNNPDSTSNIDTATRGLNFFLKAMDSKDILKQVHDKNYEGAGQSLVTLVADGVSEMTESSKSNYPHEKAGIVEHLRSGIGALAPILEGGATISVKEIAEGLLPDATGVMKGVLKSIPEDKISPETRKTVTSLTQDVESFRKIVIPTVDLVASIRDHKPLTAMVSSAAKIVNQLPDKLKPEDTDDYVSAISLASIVLEQSNGDTESSKSATKAPVTTTNAPATEDDNVAEGSAKLGGNNDAASRPLLVGLLVMSLSI